MSEQPRVKIVCPECGGPLPPEAAHVAVRCERCGHASAPLTSEQKQSCPRCRAALVSADAHGVRLLGCGVCGGIFLDNDGSVHITRAHDSVIADLAARASVGAAVRSVDTRPHALACPVCSALMRRTLARGVAEVDFCAKHGTWFDRDELNRVMNAYHKRANPVDGDARSRAEAEARMAAFRERQISSIDAAETASSVGAVGVTLGLLGVLGALVSSSDT